jgi:hypothetical protein
MTIRFAFAGTCPASLAAAGGRRVRDPHVDAPVARRTAAPPIAARCRPVRASPATPVRLDDVLGAIVMLAVAFVGIALCAAEAIALAA